jgi:predicted amidohydrolase
MARILAAAQYAARAGDVEANVARHVRYASAAAGLGVSLLVFPELSLTGYEPELIAARPELTLHAQDTRLEPLRALARRESIALLVGAPVRFGADALHIATLAFLPDGKVAVYTKRNLHEGEHSVFAPGLGGPVLQLGRVPVAMAICSDVAKAEFATEAARNKAKVYAASVLLSEAGYEADAALLSGYAKTHGMAVVMANHAEPTGGWVPAGRSAIWDERGVAVAASAGCEEALVLARRQGNSWEGAVFPMQAAAALRLREAAVPEIAPVREEPRLVQGSLFGDSSID